MWRWHFFAYRIPCTLDGRVDLNEFCPTGAVTVRAWRRKTARRLARDEATRRYRLRSSDSIAVIRARTRIDRQHVRLLDGAWLRWNRNHADSPDVSLVDATHEC